MKKLLLCSTIALSAFLTGCAQNQSTYNNEESVADVDCPYVFISSEFQTPENSYNLSFLASTSTKGYSKRLKDLQDAILLVESKNPDKADLENPVRIDIFESTDSRQTVQNIFADLLTVSYIQQAQEQGITEFDKCDISEKMKSVNYLRNTFNYDQELMINSLITEKDIRTSDLD